MQIKKKRYGFWLPDPIDLNRERIGFIMKANEPVSSENKDYVE